MTWQDEMVTILRVMIDDLDVPYKYSDTRLQQVIVAATNIVLNDASYGFAYNYIPNIIDLTIIPDPTDRITPTRDDNFVTLTLLKSACFIDKSAAKDAARKGGVAIREWNTSIDTKGVFSAALALLQSPNGWCSQYDDALFIYLAGIASKAGVGIFGPFRTIYNAYNASGGYIYGNNELFNDGRR